MNSLQGDLSIFVVMVVYYRRPEKSDDLFDQELWRYFQNAFPGIKVLSSFRHGIFFPITDNILLTDNILHFSAKSQKFSIMGG